MNLPTEIVFPFFLAGLCFVVANIAQFIFWVLKRISASILKKPAPDVGSGAFEHPWVFVKTLPRGLRYVEFEAPEIISGGAGHINDSGCYESLDNAIIELEQICSCLCGYVKPENRLFVFSQFIHALKKGSFELQGDIGIPDIPENLHDPVGHASDKKQPDVRLVVLCKLIDAKRYAPLFGREQKKGSGNREHYEVGLPDIQAIKKRLDHFHDGSCGVDAGKPASPDPETGGVA